MVLDRHLGDAQSPADQLGSDLVIGFKAAGAQVHGFDYRGGIEFVGSERIGDPALVEQRGPQGQQHSGEPRAHSLLRMLPRKQCEPGRLWPSVRLPYTTSA